MGHGQRYKVQTRYGWFSLDEGSYRDYLSGKLQWINWPPLRDPSESVKKEPLPPDVSPEAIALRENAAGAGVPQVLQAFAVVPHAPCKERMFALPVYEMNLSVRASNGLMRAGVQTFGKLDELIRSEHGIASVRNLGAKSEKEIRTAFLLECYARLFSYEKAEFWQEVLELNRSGLLDAQDDRMGSDRRMPKERSAGYER